jgi:outer membrane receptor protein involved in Fe transport
MLAAPAAAQEITAGRVSGQVVDQEGNPIEGATVTITATNRDITRTVTTGSGGTFNVTQLPIGEYTLTATAAGFGTTRVEQANVALGGTAYEIRLTAEDAAGGGEEIVVTGRAAQQLDFSQAATGVVLDVQEVAERIPVPRTIEGLTLLAPQTVAGDPGFGNSVALSGSSVAENIYYINGMNITNFRTFVGGSTVPFEFYDQVQVKTGGYQAEFGRNTGGAIIALTRSGSNEFRGGMNAFWSPANLRAKQPNSYLQNNAEDVVELLEGNVWASGPIIPDRAYFFAFLNPRYERQRYESLPSEGGTSFTRTYLSSNTPFYGGKIDLDLFEGHRAEFTYFNDSNTDVYNTFGVTGAGVETSTGTTRAYEGGENYIAKYTGSLTDWLTVSGLYGLSKFDRTTAGTQDNLPLTYDSRLGFSQFDFLQGGVAEAGSDKRQTYRFDVDVLVNLLGQHHFRFGVDHEILNADALTFYSGGGYNRIFNSSTYNPFGLAPGTNFLRQRVYNSGGIFELQNTAFYLQDNWDVTDRLQLSLGIRNDRFKNLNAAGKTFVDLKNLWSPRVGVNFDVFGDRRTKASAFFGRYYLPVAANTNIRLSGDELFTERWYTYTGDPLNPTLGTPLTGLTVFSDVSDPDPTTLVTTNLKPQFMDEFILGFEHRFAGRWRAGLNLVHRDLKNVLEDYDVEQYALGQFCKANPTVKDCEDLAVGGGGYVLFNPGRPIIVNVAPHGDFAGGLLTFTPEQLDVPKARRRYWAAEFSFDRSFDGLWGLAGSYTWSKTRGNYEGGVKSDNDQDDVGLTQDYDEPGWMDGSYGNLPNDRRHQFKLYGTFAPMKNVLIGMSARVASPRSFGCIGIYPFEDDRAQNPFDPGGADSWYCGDRSTTFTVAGQDYAKSSILVGRGGAFKSEWEKRVDLSFQYEVPMKGIRGMKLRADVFNVFNFDSPIEYVEQGDADGPVSAGAPGVPKGSVPLNENYGKPTSFQTPRYLRLGISFDF